MKLSSLLFKLCFFSELSKKSVDQKSPNSAKTISIIFLNSEDSVRAWQKVWNASSDVSILLTRQMRMIISYFADFTQPTFLLPMLFTQNDSTTKTDSFWSKCNPLSPFAHGYFSSDGHRGVEDTLQFYQDQMPHGRRGTMKIDLWSKRHIFTLFSFLRIQYSVWKRYCIHGLLAMLHI